MPQGSAADVAKRAMLALHARLPPEDACLVNMLHDELLLEVRQDRLQRVSAPGWHAKGRGGGLPGMVRRAGCDAGEKKEKKTCRHVLCAAKANTPSTLAVPLLSGSCTQQVAALVRDCMEGAAPEVTVPLRVQLRVGRSWGELVPFELTPLPDTEDAVGPTPAAEPSPVEAAAGGPLHGAPLQRPLIGPGAAS